MTDPEAGPKPPSLVPGVVLLIVAAALMIVLLIDPSMPTWMQLTIVLITIAVIIALLIYAVVAFRLATKGGRR